MRRTLAEKHLWNILKGSKTGFVWFQQVPMLDYFLDFYCHTLKVAIEIDGGSHTGREEYDAERDAALRKRGVRTIRLSNERALEFNLASMIEWIKVVCQNKPASEWRAIGKRTACEIEREYRESKGSFQVSICT